MRRVEFRRETEKVLLDGPVLGPLEYYKPFQELICNFKDSFIVLQGFPRRGGLSYATSGRESVQ
jgi:hypothetical protein